MSHNPNAAIDNEAPGSGEPASFQPDPGGAASSEPVGGGLQGSSVVSDIVHLTAGLEREYEGFDPTIHAVGPDGKPRLRRDGSLAKKRGRKAGGSQAPIQSTVTVDPANPLAGQAQISNDQAAKMLCGMAVAGFQLLLGPEWDVENQGEAKALIDGTRAYLEATGGMDMSPSVGLLFTWGGYSLPRLGKPETLSRFARFRAWMVSMVRRK